MSWYPFASPVRDADETRRLAPFADQIELLVRAHSCSRRPYGLGPNGTYRIVRREEQALRDYSAKYALEHGRLPTGQVRLHHPGFNSIDEVDWFDVDFDVLAAAVARACEPLSLPKSYRLPRDERVLFFEQKIDALVSAFDDRFLIDRGRESRRRFWLQAFLRDYVEDYERLPSGRMRAASIHIPLPSPGYDFGEVDFDALRQAAGLPGDADEHHHSGGAPSS
jgi:hypothetical protein